MSDEHMEEFENIFAGITDMTKDDFVEHYTWMLARTGSGVLLDEDTGHYTPTNKSGLDMDVVYSGLVHC